ncbi:Protein CBG21609 [Caenorhabditis briggsae]|uniref:Protein CBG21609 n=2 Tax=Caenorhabditis briggsae TaxID=6238 RepID=A8Y073_CAEBR|nr:Protein CBG21609 [Caenorhabditis briggsae]ULT93506.1 hypothetical protein L3Y34_003179 [Caenorhabditis briggsae]CAP38363.2 Protein CBG21609 [Caenorhabditis briggsae]
MDEQVRHFLLERFNAGDSIDQAYSDLLPILRGRAIPIDADEPEPEPDFVAYERAEGSGPPRFSDRIENYASREDDEDRYYLTNIRDLYNEFALEKFNKLKENGEKVLKRMTDILQLITLRRITRAFSELANWFEIRLERVKFEFASVVDEQWARIDITEEREDLSTSILYLQHRRSVLVSYNGRNLTRIDNRNHKDIAAFDLAFILQRLEQPLEELKFRIKPYEKNDRKLFPNLGVYSIIDSILRDYVHPYQVKTQCLNFMFTREQRFKDIDCEDCLDSENLMCILKYLEPGTLDCLALRVWDDTHVVTGWQHILTLLKLLQKCDMCNMIIMRPTILVTEQWKRLETLDIRDLYVFKDWARFTHLQRINLFSFSVREVRQARLIFKHFPPRREYQITVEEPMNLPGIHRAYPETNIHHVGGFPERINMILERYFQKPIVMEFTTNEVSVHVWNGNEDHLKMRNFLLNKFKKRVPIRLAHEYLVRWTSTLKYDLVEQVQPRVRIGNLPRERCCFFCEEPFEEFEDNESDRYRLTMVRDFYEEFADEFFASIENILQEKVGNILQLMFCRRLSKRCSERTKTTTTIEIQMEKLKVTIYPNKELRIYIRTKREWGRIIYFPKGPDTCIAYYWNEQDCPKAGVLYKTVVKNRMPCFVAASDLTFLIRRHSGILDELEFTLDTWRKTHPLEFPDISALEVFDEFFQASAKKCLETIPVQKLTFMFTREKRFQDPDSEEWQDSHALWFILKHLITENLATLALRVWDDKEVVNSEKYREKYERLKQTKIGGRLKMFMNDTITSMDQWRQRMTLDIRDDLLMKDWQQFTHFLEVQVKSMSIAEIDAALAVLLRNLTDDYGIQVDTSLPLNAIARHFQDHERNDDTLTIARTSFDNLIPVHIDFEKYRISLFVEQLL